jgi:hypothetical protein
MTFVEGLLAPHVWAIREITIYYLSIYIYANIYLTGLIRAIYSKGYTHPPEDSNKSITIITIQELDAKTGK